ncbi:hypothetical protein [Salegentibacter sp. F14]
MKWTKPFIALGYIPTPALSGSGTEQSSSWVSSQLASKTSTPLKRKSTGNLLIKKLSIQKEIREFMPVLEEISREQFSIPSKA